MNKSSLLGRNPFDPMDSNAERLGYGFSMYEQGKYDVLLTLNDYYIKTGKGLKELEKFVKWAEKQSTFKFDKAVWEKRLELNDMVKKVIKEGIANERANKVRKRKA